MATVIQTIHAFSAATGAPLSGLTPVFTGAGFYRINNAPAVEPAIAEIGTTGSYRFTATLAENDTLEWKVDLGATALNRYAFNTVTYAEIVQPASDETNDPPTVTNFVPADGSAITVNQAISFDVTDDLSSFRRIMILASFSSTSIEVVYDGTAFRSYYTDLSTKTVIAGGFTFSIRRTGGWPSTPTIEIYPIDTSGNEAS